MKNRDGKRQMVQVGASDVGVVGQQNVAGVDVVQPPVLDFGLDHIAHAADEHGQPQANRQGLTLAVEQTHGEVQRLVNDHVVGRAHQHRLHLFGGRDQAVAHQLHRHRVGFIHGGRALGCARRDGRFFGFRTGFVHMRSQGWRSVWATSMCKLPWASTCRRSPGCSTVVVACSSISAGPSSRLLARSSSRW